MFPVRAKRRGGFTIICMLMALAIIGILTQEYLGVDGPEGKTFVQSTQDRARTAVVAMNLNTARTNFFMATEGRRLEPEPLRQVLDDLSRRMGGDGRYWMDQNQNVQITTMVETRTFRERLPDNLPRAR